MRRASLVGAISLGFVGVFVACGSNERRSGFDPDVPDASLNDANTTVTSDAGFGDNVDGGGDPGLPEGETRDPEDCNEAKTSKSYVGCDYWPTITPNSVWSLFDFAVVVANTGKNDAEISVTGPNAVAKNVTVPAGELRKIYLPWLSSLKGPDFDACGAANPLGNSSIASESAYHLVSSSPVIVYQFNALEYKAEGGEGPDGGTKDWSSCPGSKTDCVKGIFNYGKVGCFSFSNDASLLLPTTAMTTNYRVAGYKGASATPFLGQEQGVMPVVLSITATEPNTEVSVSLAPSGTVAASVSGQTVNATPGGSTLTLSLAKAGDIAQLVSEKGKTFDFSGSLVQTNHPVQVIASVPCTNIPNDKAACDHIEQTVLPAETLGKRYVVTSPTGVEGLAAQHLVRLYGNQDGTQMTYKPAKPSGCPDTLNAGQVAECSLTSDAFEVSGDKEFAVASFQLGAQVLGPQNRKGDPSQSTFASVEQFRTKYVFLAPDDYPLLFADITATEDAAIEVDGAPIKAPWTKIGSGPFGVHRVDLATSGKDGAHTLTAKRPVGVQVIGYGDNTSFQYPAGLNLKLIAPPPQGPK